MPGSRLEPLHIPEGFWRRSDVAEALTARDFGRLFDLIHQWTGASQTKIGAAIEQSQTAISAVVRRVRRFETIDVLERIADGLDFPDTARLMVGFAPQHMTVGQILSARAPNEPGKAMTAALTYPPEVEQGVTTVTELFEADLTAAPEAAQAKVDNTAWHSATLGWLITDSGQQLNERPVGHRVDMSTVRAIRETKNVFADLDNQFGGAHARLALVQYLRSDAAGMLNGSYTEAIGKELFRAIAETTHLAAWMSYDAGQHGLAQRYFIQALRLAEAGDDRQLAGSVLDAMSHQATFLGKYQEAAQLAQAALTGTRGRSTPTMSAHFLTMKARAHAKLGDARATDLALSQAVELFERRNPDDDPEYIRYFDEAELSAEFGHCFRDLGRPVDATRYATESLGSNGAYLRSDFFAGMVLADAHLTAGNLDEACRVALQVLQAGDSLQSARCVQYLREFQAGLTGRGRNSVTDAFNDQARPYRLWQKISTPQ
jgi:tetratricopeptide (TPR) repeat protein